MNAPEVRRWWIALGLFAVLGIALRIHNATEYGIGWGFDSIFHWAYVRRLLIRGWHLPDPESGWSMYRPPLFFFSAAALIRSFGASAEDVYRSFVTVRLASSAFGFATLAFSLAVIHRAVPMDLRRLTIATALLMLLPVHLYMSAMFNEEVLLGGFSTLALCFAAWPLCGPQAERASPRARLGFAFAAGVCVGLAAMTKLTGVLFGAPPALVLIVDAWRRGRLRDAVAPVLVLSAVAALLGGWFYLRNLVVHGYLWPYSLGVHQVILGLPPGERGLLDYVYVPLATFFDARALQPELLRSVWGSTYASFWYDSHRHFVPKDGAMAQQMGAAILLLSLVPTAAGLRGLWAGARRALLERSLLDTLLVSSVLLVVAGYAAYTWKNPWYATVKGSYLLGLLLPFAFYASESLSAWVADPGPEAGLARRALRWALWGLLVAWVLCVLVSFRFETFLWERSSGPVGFPNAPAVPEVLQR